MCLGMQQHLVREGEMQVCQVLEQNGNRVLHMSRFLPAFVARDGTQNLPMVGLIRWVVVCMQQSRHP